MIVNFLYCFDENYNVQALTSINSLLNNVSEKINLHIIHKDPESFKSLEALLENKNKIKNISYYKYKNNDTKFPKLKGAHVSEATYYRMFIDDYIPNDVGFLVYLDADIVCLNNPIHELENTILKMKKENKPLGAMVEGTRSNSEELFEKLDLKNNNHFNAGVIIIDYKKWKQDNTAEKLLQIMKERFEKIIYWDQDILNIYYDDNFTKMNKDLNYGYSATETDYKLNAEVKGSVSFLHYSGKSKPWNVENIIYPGSDIYQNEFRKVGTEKYHIVFKKNFKTFIRYFKLVFSLKFLTLENPVSYLKISLVKMFK